MQYKYRNATWSDKNKKIVRVEVLLNNVWVETCYDFNNPGDLTDLRNQIPISLIKEPVESENLISKQKQIDKLTVFYNGNEYQANDTSINMINSYINSEYKDVINWKTKDNEIVPLTLDDLKKLLRLILQKINSIRNIENNII